MNIVIIGAGGFIGSAISRFVINSGHGLFASFHSEKQEHEFMRSLGDLGQQSSTVVFGSVCDVITSIENLRASLGDDGIDHIVYAVGHCPPGGFVDVSSRQLSQYDLDDMRREYDMHVVGAFNVFKTLLGCMNKGGSMTFMSSAATRLLDMPRVKRPPVPIYHHISAIQALNALVEGMRMDTVAALKNIKFHTVRPPAISDSPFHEKDSLVDPSRRSPVSVTSTDVIRAVMSCMYATEHQDLVVLPPKPLERETTQV